MSARLESLRLINVRECDGDDYAALDKLTGKINQLRPLARTKDWDDEAKVCFLTKAGVYIMEAERYPTQNRREIITFFHHSPIHINEIARYFQLRTDTATEKAMR